MGPKKGKTKGSKLARMTDEERARYMQHRAAVEEEARRRKQQLIATFMKNQLKKEEGFARLNLAKINQQWWQILRAIKTQQLQQELKHLWQFFNHLMDQKQQMFDVLLVGLQEAEEHYSKGWRYHAELIDSLLVLQEQRLQQLYTDYKAEKQSLVEGSVLLAHGVFADALASEECLKTITHLLTTKAVADEVSYGFNHQTGLHDVTDTAVTEEDALQTAHQSRMEKMWHQFEQVLGNYAAATEPRLGAHLRLQERDAQSAQTIARQRERIDELQRQVSALRAHMPGRGQQQVACLAAERDNLELLFCRMRQQLEVVCTQDEQQLTFMTVTSNRVIKKLQFLATKADQILSLASVYRKKETEQEKVMPFGIQPFLPKEVEIPSKDEAAIISLQKDELRGFWVRYNRAYLQRQALDLHYQALFLENKQLQEELRQYLGVANDQSFLAPWARPCTTSTRRKPCLVTVLPGWRKPSTTITVHCVVEASTSCAARQLRTN